jgi:hypothetical protein
VLALGNKVGHSVSGSPLVPSFVKGGVATALGDGVLVRHLVMWRKEAMGQGLEGGITMLQGRTGDFEVMTDGVHVVEDLMVERWAPGVGQHCGGVDGAAVMMTVYEYETEGGEDRVRVAKDLEIGRPEVVEEMLGLGSQVIRVRTAVAELVEVLRLHGHGY